MTLPARACMSASEEHANEALALLAGAQGDRSYGEALSLRAHSLQAAMLAAQAGLGTSFIAAALLHDVGWAWDARTHETSGAEWARIRFGDDVADPILLHVDAKRYLVAPEPDYRTRLSRSSIATLDMQGGAMNEADAAAFRAAPGFDHAIALRGIDDAAKSADARTPSLEAYRPLLREMALATLRGKDVPA